MHATRRLGPWVLALVGVLLAACGGGGGDSAPPAPPPTSAPSVPPPNTVANTASYQQFVADRVSPISSLTDDANFSDLHPIGAAIGNRRLVQLGESSHGSGSMNQFKTRLIKYLHQQHGFNVIAFESSTFSCNRGLEDRSDMSAEGLMAGCIFGVWYTREVEELFRYIKQTQGSSRPLRLSGFDVQISSGTETPASLSAGLTRLLPALPAVEREAVIAAALGANTAQGQGRACFGGDSQACQQLLDQHRARSLALDRAIDLVAGQAGRSAALADAVLLSLRHALEMEESIAKRTGRMFETRDLGMARVLIRLAERVFPEDKIMVWAHNAHIAEDYPWQSLRSNSELVMGMHLHQHWGDQLYTIGLYMSGGQQADNGGRVSNVTAHQADSLEALFQPLAHVASFLPLPKQDLAEAGDDWLHQLSIHKDWGRFEQRAHLARTYDALLVIRTSQAPVYISRN